MESHVGLHNIVGASKISPLGKVTGRAAWSPMGTHGLERWNSLKQLPHKIVRDIGFVISSPPILMDSDELPTVSPSMLGGDVKTWGESVKWLATLDVDQVNQWFGARSNNGRLGEHFAFCVEYVLTHSPLAYASNLVTYQQVTHRPSLRSLSHVSKQEDLNGITIEAGDGVLIRMNSQCGPHMRMDDTPSEPSQVLGKPNDEEMLCPRADEIETCRVEKGCTDGPSCEKLGRRKNKLLKKMQRLREGNEATVTIGEFDFLFEHSAMMKPLFSPREIPLPDSGHTKVFHWEVSVKFLLYAGPWGVFGCETPPHAAWKCSNQEPCEEERKCPAAVSGKHKLLDSFGRCEWKGDASHKDEFLGCFLGPHVGETLYNRKTRLITQLSLSRNVHAATLLCKLFGPSISNQVNYGNHLPNGEVRAPHVDKQVDCEQMKMLHVSPQALLKGYLFYECDLWHRLCTGEGLVQCVHVTGGSQSSDADKYPNSTLNSEHWMGWWARMHDFLSFAQLPMHIHSRWYIVPKLEWLSPIVIEADDGIRMRQLLILDEFLVVAAKVAEEAEKANMVRKRRFMVAEMVWEVAPRVYSQSSQTDCNVKESLKGNGSWIEVSRGFIVEDTWPNSRMYRPHGYRLHDSPI